MQTCKFTLQWIQSQKWVLYGMHSTLHAYQGYRCMRVYLLIVCYSYGFIIDMSKTVDFI